MIENVMFNDKHSLIYIHTDQMITILFEFMQNQLC